MQYLCASEWLNIGISAWNVTLIAWYNFFELCRLMFVRNFRLKSFDGEELWCVSNFDSVLYRWSVHWSSIAGKVGIVDWGLSGYSSVLYSSFSGMQFFMSQAGTASFLVLYIMEFFHAKFCKRADNPMFNTI